MLKSNQHKINVRSALIQRNITVHCTYTFSKILWSHENSELLIHVHAITYMYYTAGNIHSEV